MRIIPPSLELSLLDIPTVWDLLECSAETPQMLTNVYKVVPITYFLSQEKELEPGHAEGTPKVLLSRAPRSNMETGCSYLC